MATQPTTVSVVKISDARSAGRAKARRITCSFGQVADISADGMRVTCRGKLPAAEGDVMPMSIHTPSGVIALSAQVVWVAKSGILRHEMGLRFVDVAEKAQRNLEFTLKLCHLESKRDAA